MPWKSRALLCVIALAALLVAAAYPAGALSKSKSPAVAEPPAPPTSTSLPAAAAPAALTALAEAAPAALTVPAAAAPAALTVSTTGGNAFDTCKAPTLPEMTAWLASPYRSVGIYVGGVARACAQPNLTRDWVAGVTAMGWGLLPLYVGLQAPCYHGKKQMSAVPAVAAGQGRDAAADAIAQMAALGLPRSTPVYFDMENYSTTDAACVAAVRAFTHAWTSTLQAKGYQAGIYGSSNSMITHLVSWRGDPAYRQPDEIWIARWNGIATTDDTAVPADAWPMRRVHQFAGGHRETWGGVTLNIDSNITSTAATFPSALTAVPAQTVWDSRQPIVGTTPVALRIAGHAGVPWGASAAVLTIQVIRPTAAGSVIIEPYRGRSTIGQQHFAAGAFVSTTVVVPLVSGNVQFRLTAGNARVIVSALGYLSDRAADPADPAATDVPGHDLVTAVAPSTIWDSKTASVGTAPVALRVAGHAGVPRSATAAILTVAVAGATSAGNLVVAPYRGHSTSGVQQYFPGRGISTTMVVPLSAGNIQFRLTAGRARVTVSAQGYLDAGAGGPMTSTNSRIVWDSVTSRITTAPTALKLAGNAGIPPNATAAMVTLQVIRPTATGSLLLGPYQAGDLQPVQQFSAGQSIATTALVPLQKGNIQFRLTAGQARVIVSTLAYVTPVVSPPPST